MPRPVCRICEAPNGAAEIVNKLLDKKTFLRDIARQTGFSKSSVHRHAQKCYRGCNSGFHSEDNSRVRFLDREPGGEYERLMNVVRKDYPEHLAELIFSLNTGLRLSSQYTATYEMLDLTRNELDLPRSKNDQPIHAPLNASVLAALRSLPSWAEKKGPIFRSQRHPNRPVLSNDHWFKPALREAGISDYTWHCNRHSFASWLIQDGVALERVSKLLGHKSLAMTMRYAHLAPNKLHEDVALLSKMTSTTVAPEQNQQASVTATYVN